METATLKSFATRARTELIKEVSARVSVVLEENSLARVESLAAVRSLEAAIVRDGRDQVIDRVAYTWFNRIIALRFMDANGYTPSAIVSPEAGRTTGQPEVLAEAKAGVFDSAVVPAKTQETITALLNRTRPSQDPDGEAYGLLLEAYCRSWHEAMPFMFEREGDYTELLIPAALLAVDSVRDRAVKTLTEDVCRDVEVIGWLYQFYISERKDEVFDGFKKKKKAGAAEIPAATQLFTPHWIVRYLVENSLGRLWLLNNPSSRLAEQMDYYIKPVDEETDFLKIAKPEELRIIDPAVGSGHMLTYAFDLLYAIYTERGYDPAEIPGLILRHNLYGTEIDPRAGALAAFALTMKAAAKRKLFLKNPIQPNVCVLENVAFDSEELDYLWSVAKVGSFVRGDVDEFWNAFERADTLGSLIQPKERLMGPLTASIERVDADGDLLERRTLQKARLMLKQAEYLSKRYSVVVANPPYMGIRNADSRMNDFAASHYPASKADLFAMFIERSLSLLLNDGRTGLITMQSWMFIKSFGLLRERLLGSASISTLTHLGTGAFESISGEVVSTVAWVMGTRRTEHSASFIRVVDLRGDSKRAEVARAASGGYTNRQYRMRLGDLLALPGSPVAYWLSPEVISAFATQPSVGSKFTIKVGMQTSNNAKFLRYWWEPSHSRLENPSDGLPAWITYAKGGPFRRWTGNLDSVLHFNLDPEYVLSQPNATLLPMEALKTSKITWTHMSPGPVSFRRLPADTFHDIGSHAIYVTEDDSWWLLGYLNTRFVGDLIHALNPTVNIQTSDLARIPMFSVDRVAVGGLAQRAVAISSADESTQETERAFSTSPVLTTETLRSRLTAEAENWRVRSAELLAVEEELEEVVAASTGMPPLQDGYGVALYNSGSSPVESNRRLAGDLVSYAVGCMFGRYSLDEPGLILADQGSTLEDYLAKVPTPSFTPDQDNVIPIVDGDWFEDDIVARFRKFLRAAFGEDHFEENLRFVTESLGVKDVRDYFVKSFYDDHVKRYKKRPIYWLFRSPRGSFSALIYLHRYNPSTVSTVLTGYLREFIGKLEANLEHQGRVAAGMGGASARDIATALKEADRIRKVLVELRDYEHDVLFPLAGQQITLDLDEGVLVNYQMLGAALKDIGLKKGSGGE